MRTFKNAIGCVMNFEDGIISDEETEQLKNKGWREVLNE